MATEIDFNIYDEAVKKYKKLLAQKDKLVKKESDDGRNQFQIKLNELKKSIKGLPFKFKDVMKDTLKQEREGKFDRGAEGKKKNKLRAKMAKEPQTKLTKGVHEGSYVSEILEKGVGKYRAPKTSEENVDLAKSLAGETDAEKEKRKKLKKEHQGRGAK